MIERLWVYFYFVLVVVVVVVFVFVFGSCVEKLMAVNVSVLFWIHLFPWPKY